MRDEALAAFPSFPALRELTPIGVQDAGFRHIGRCERLERLTCMYCRDTTDRATEHIGQRRRPTNAQPSPRGGARTHSPEPP